MLDIMQTALNGLRAAEARAYQAASNIAELRVAAAGVEAATPTGATSGVVTGLATVQTPPSGGGHPNAEGQDFATAGGHDLATDLIELKIARHAYDANLAVVRTADEMSKHLINSVA